MERSSPEQETLQTFAEGKPGRSHQYLSEIYNMFALYSSRPRLLAGGPSDLLTSSFVPFQGCDRRRYYVIYVNVLKIDVIYVIFDFEDVIRYFCQNETLFLSN